jgi:DNA-binding NtrC family response regulator
MPEAAGGGATVLVADDERQLLRVLVRVLEHAGYAVLSASDGREALLAAEPRSAALAAVVLDLAIRPTGAGPVLQALSERGVRPAVVLTSGHLPEEPVREILEEWGGVFLPKPFAPRALLRALDQALAARRPDGADAQAREAG